jgi:hypothetical protein
MPTECSPKLFDLSLHLSKGGLLSLDLMADRSHRTLGRCC